MITRTSSIFDISLLVYFLAGFNLVCISLSLCGSISTSPGLPDIFFLKFTGNETDIRFGYFGICQSIDDQLACGPFRTMASQVRHSDSGTFNIIDSLHLNIFMPVLAVAGVSMLLGILAFVVTNRKHKRSYDEQFNPRAIRSWELCTRSCLWIGTVFLYVSAWSTTQTLNGLALIASDAGMEVGKPLQGLQWTAAGTATLLSIGASVLLRTNSPLRDEEA